jgi:hypothetical protein
MHMPQSLMASKGTMSEAELHLLRARLLGGQLHKARRGELWMRPPIGYVYTDSHGLDFDSDEQIQGTVRLLFETFRRTGSACQVVRHFTQARIRWPRRLTTGPRKGEILWVPLVLSRVLQVLHNPRYAGAYVYGRTRQRKGVIGVQVQHRKLPREEWKVFLPDTAPAYVSWAEYEANQATLRSNAAGYGTDRRRSPPREGTALLQGIILCGRCGERMTVRYSVRSGHPSPDYVCQKQGIESAKPPCQRIPGTAADTAVAQQILSALTPTALDIALEVFQELRARRVEVDRLRQVEVQRAREEAELAQQQFLRVRPEHRLVADQLERQWNEKLARLTQLQDALARTHAKEDADPSAEQKERIYALVADLPRVWHDPRTPARERKRMLRLLVEDVTLLRHRRIRIQIRWKGGATTSLEQPLPLSAPDLRRTPAAIVEQVRVLATEKADRQIAASLNARGLRSGTGQSFTRLRVRQLRDAYEIPSFAQHLRVAGWLTAPEMASQLGVHLSTAKRFAREGALRALRADDAGQILFEPIHGPLPKAQPGKRYRDRRCHPKLATYPRKELQYEA